MGKFKDLITGNKEKQRLDEAVGGVISTPAINSGSGVDNGRQGNATRSGDSRIDTGGEFTYNAGELEGFSGNTKPNPKQSFQEKFESDQNSLVLHEDDGGSVMLRETSQGHEVVVRAGSQEKAFELDEDAEQAIQNFFG